MSNAKRHNFFIGSGEGRNADFVLASDYDSAQSELAALREELAKVIEDRARFPDRPDFIGHMIGSHIGNLKAGKESSDNYARTWYDRMKVAEQRLAHAERQNAVMSELLHNVNESVTGRNGTFARIPADWLDKRDAVITASVAALNNPEEAKL